MNLFKRIRFGWLTKHLMPNTGTLLVLVLFFLTQSVGARPPTESEVQATATLLSYQGTLTDKADNPINGSVDIVFRLYRQATGGTAFWTESYTGANAIQVSNGQFHVLLGSRTALSPTDLSGDLYLGITVNGEEMSPRELLVSAVRAVQASHLVTIDTPDVSATSGGIEINDRDGRTMRIDGNELDSTDGLHLQRAHPERAIFAYTNLNMQANRVTNVAALESQGNTIQMASGSYPAIRLVSKNSAHVFIDSDNNATDRAFSVLRDNSYFGSPVAEILRVDENGTITAYGQLNMQGNDVSGVTNVYGAGSQQILMPANSPNTYFNWYRGDSVHFGGGDQTAYASIDRTGLNMHGNPVVNCGALIESNLQTPEEMTAERIDRFSEGDVLCWSPEDDRLEKCAAADDRLVQAVADPQGRPIVIGAEVIKVLGPVQAGDILVASDVPGYAMVNNEPRPGSAIAQALEDFDGVQGVVKAMIRKF